jgi:hypothetical protein
MQTEDTIWCDGCGAEIAWGPVTARNRIYCCRECAQGIPCECGDRMEIDDENHNLGTKPPITSGYLA